MRSPLLVLICAGTLAACRATPPPPAASATPPPLPADVQKVASELPTATGDAKPAVAPAADKAEFTGEFVSPVRSELSARIAGRVGKVFVDEGARVRRGQPLLEIETEYLKLEMKRADAEVARASAAATEAARDLERKQGLLGKGSVSQAAFDRSQSAAETSAAMRQSAVASLELAKEHLHDAVLVSPIDGVVVERRADVGERLGDSTVAFIVEQTAPLKLRFRVPERYLAQVRTALPVKASVDPYPGEAFTGRVSVVGAAVDAANRTFLVEAEFENRDGRLRPGLFARVQADLGARQ